MQAINRIHNAKINANAGIQGAMVVASANAHRAYPSFKPCVVGQVSKCPVTDWRSSSTEVSSTSRTRPSVDQRDRRTQQPVGTMWQMEMRHLQMPAMLWATLVLNRQLCG